MPDLTASAPANTSDLNTAGRIADLNNRLTDVEHHVQVIAKIMADRLIEGINALRSELGLEPIDPGNYTK
jgi:hypothetical protein